ncbi:redoxin domain-containing protein [Pueribacillus theae]|uniref:redoxin domain-containing protein n=1 Tax=Pueribacillus theae TaxID=2171751 RepID=UPI001401C7A3|nr:redoxin domain-containing protein [Pueribacillus theae]
MKLKSWMAIGILVVLGGFFMYGQFFEKADTIPDNEAQLDENQAPTTENFYEESGLKIGEMAPDFTLNDMQGNPVSLSDFRGKKVILNFWGSFCGPCREEMPAMQKFYETYKEKDVEVVAVNLTYFERKREEVDQFVEEFGLTFPIPLDEKGKQKEVYKIIPIPTSYFLDEKGIVQQVHFGPMTYEFMEETIKNM